MAYQTEAKRKTEYQHVMSYDDWEEIKEGMNSRRRAKAARERENRAKYYCRQRILGFLILAVGVICLLTGCMINQNIVQYFGAASGLVGLYVIMTKSMVLVDRYYLEFQDRINEY